MSFSPLHPTSTATLEWLWIIFLTSIEYPPFFGAFNFFNLVKWLALEKYLNDLTLHVWKSILKVANI